MADITLKRYKVSYTGGGDLRITIPKLVVDAWGLKVGEHYKWSSWMQKN